MKMGALLKEFLNKNSIITIMSLALPAIIENTLQVFLGVVDTYFIGKIGTEAIAAVGITNLIMNIYIAFFLALGIGTSALVSRNIYSIHGNSRCGFLYIFTISCWIICRGSNGK